MSSAAFLTAAFLAAAFLAAAFLAAAFCPRISDDRKSARWSRDFNAPGRSPGYSARRAHRLDLREAYLVSVTEFTTGSGQL